MLYHTRYAIYLTVSFIAALTAYRLAFFVFTNVAPRLAGTHTPELENQAKHRSRKSTAFRLRRIPAAGLSCLRVLFCRLTVPFGLGASITLGDLLVILGYLSALLSFEFINGTFLPAVKTSSLTVGLQRETQPVS